MGYLTMSRIGDDPFMRARVASCAAEQGCADAGIEPDVWALVWRRAWGAAAGWDAAWESALANGNTAPGLDPAVITDGQILSQVQDMMPFRLIQGG
jgi:hypothetical protein